jgi:hypothetical protein
MTFTHGTTVQQEVIKMSHICLKNTLYFLQKFNHKKIVVLLSLGLLSPLSGGSFLFAADQESAMETQDLSGSTSHFSGTIGTTSTTIPAVANKVISEVFFKCDNQTPIAKQCLISFDAGVSWLSIGIGEAIAWSVKGRIKQIRVKASTAGVTYQGLINYEAY